MKLKGMLWRVAAMAGVGAGLCAACYDKAENGYISLPSSSSKVRIPMGCSFKYQHSVHGSVGFDYHAEYDTDAFEMECYIKYHNPESVEAGECGGDEATKTFVFKPLKTGSYTIKIIHEFRGDVKRVITYNVIVKE